MQSKTSETMNAWLRGRGGAIPASTTMPSSLMSDWIRQQAGRGTFASTTMPSSLMSDWIRQQAGRGTFAPATVPVPEPPFPTVNAGAGAGQQVQQPVSVNTAMNNWLRGIEQDIAGLVHTVYRRD